MKTIADLGLRIERRGTLETKRTITAIVIATAVFLLWTQVFGPRLMPPPPAPTTTTQPEQAKPTAPAPTPAATPATSTQPAVATSAPEAVGTITVKPATTAPAEAVILGSAERPKTKKDSHYLMRLELTPRGAGVKGALLTDYSPVGHTDKNYPIINRDGWDQDWPANMATTKVVVNGQTVDLADKNWRLVDAPAVANGQSAVFQVELLQDGRPLLDIRKTFTLVRDSFELDVQYQLVSHVGGRTLEVALSGAGILSPDKEGVRDERELVWAHSPNPNGANPKVERVATSKVVKEGKHDLPKTADSDGLVWAAQANRFFALVLRPISRPGPAIEFTTTPLGKSDDSRVEVAWTALKLTLTPTTTAPDAAGEATVAFQNYIGPKDRELFTDTLHYSSLKYDDLINYGSCSYCLFAPLVTVMFKLLSFLHMIIPNWGLTIIVLVAIVRLILHPLTRKSQVSMSKMSKLQPRMEELKKKDGENKAELNRAMAEFYRKEGFSPMLGCLPMFLQMPIWIALWGVLNAAIDLRNASFLWIKDLSSPDAIINFSQPIALPIVGWMIYSLNLLTLLLMGAMFIQQMLTPMTGTGQQAKQQRMTMYFMAPIFGLMFYNMPSGLSLYVMASTAVGAAEQYVIRKHIRERDAAEAAGGVVRRKEEPPPSTGRGRRRRR